MIFVAYLKHETPYNADSLITIVHVNAESEKEASEKVELFCKNHKLPMNLYGIVNAEHAEKMPVHHLIV